MPADESKKDGWEEKNVYGKDKESGWKKEWHANKETGESRDKLDSVKAYWDNKYSSWACSIGCKAVDGSSVAAKDALNTLIEEKALSSQFLFWKISYFDSTSDNEVNTPNKTHEKPLSLDELETSNKAKRTLDIYSLLSSNKSRRIIKQEKP